MLQKFTKAENVIVLDQEDQIKIAQSVAKTSKVALHEVLDIDRVQILNELDSD